MVKRLVKNWQVLFSTWLGALLVVFMLVGNANGIIGAMITAVFGLALIYIVYVIEHS